jgi:hypothetical protein
MNIPTSRSELMSSGATCIAHVSSREGHGITVWTELSLWWNDDDEDRPYLAVVEGCAERADLEQRFRACRYGSISRAMASFDPSNLRDRLSEALPPDLADVYPDANTLRSRRAAANAEGRGFRGPADMASAVGWLYAGEDQPSVNAMARRVEADFGVPWRTVTNAINGGVLSGWAAGFLAALRFFDRKAWSRAKQPPGRNEKETADVG